MKKRDECENPNSCWNKAKDDEIVFVLRDTDPAFVATVRFWQGERLRFGINNRADHKIVSAGVDANEVELKQRNRQ